MAPAKSTPKSILKKSSKAAAPEPTSSSKSAPKPSKSASKEAAPVSTTAESSTKAAKTLKRKKGVEVEESAVGQAEVEVSEAPKASKKAKKEKDATVVKAKEVVKVVEVAEEKPKKSAKGKVAKAKDAQESAEDAPAPTPAKKTKSTAKTAEPLPTSISRPRGNDAKAKSKKSKKAKSPSPVDEDEDVASDDEEAPEAKDSDAEEDEDEGHLHGFSTDDDDSSDEEDGMDMEVDLGKLPTIAKDDAAVKRKLEKAKQNPGEDRGVLFLGRLPHGFYEDQLKAYFSQFGNVTRLRVSRNKKTGKSKHYGFIEFDSSAVAQIVADTMDNYLLMGHIMRCKVIPKDEVHPELWVGANRKWRVVPKDRVARAEHDRPRTDAEQARANKRLLKRQAERKAKLAKSGIDYDFDAVAYKAPASAAIKV